MTAARRAVPSRPPAGRDGFAQLLRAEWTKFRTVRGWVLGMVVAAAGRSRARAARRGRQQRVQQPADRRSPDRPACPAPPIGPGR